MNYPSLPRSKANLFPLQPAPALPGEPWAAQASGGGKGAAGPALVLGRASQRWTEHGNQKYEGELPSPQRWLMRNHSPSCRFSKTFLLIDLIRHICQS